MPFLQVRRKAQGESRAAAADGQDPFSFSAVLGTSMLSVAVGLAGLIISVLGRVFWELFFVGRQTKS
jgi:hypothetical protein